MRSLRVLFSVLFFAMSVCAIAIFSVTQTVTQLRSQNSLYHQELYQFYRLSQELKDSSDHLSKFARAYANNGDPHWERLFNQVLDVRNGKLPLPPGNEYEYWDLAVLSTSERPPEFNGNRKPLLDRIRESGIEAVEFLELKNALSLSDGLVQLEREAFMAIKGFKKDDKGEFADVGQPDLLMARRLLYSERYFTEKAKIMSAIAAAHQSILLRMDQKITRSNQEAMFYEDVKNVLLLILLLIIFSSFALLWRLYIYPLSQLLSTVVTQVGQENYAVTIKQSAYGELREFITCLNTVFRHITEQLEQNNLVKDFNIVMRNNQSTERLCQEVTRFIQQEFSIEMVGIYIYQDEQLHRVSGVGYGNQENSEILDASSTQYNVLMSGKEYSLKELSGHYFVHFNGGELSYNELYYLPMYVNDHPVALLELGVVHTLSQQKHQWLSYMLNDLSVSIQLSQNVDIQRNAERKVIQQSQLNQEILNATPNPMYCLSSEGRYLTINARFIELIGLPASEIIHKKPDDIFDSKTADIFSGIHNILHDSQNSQEFEISIIDNSGQQCDIQVYEASFYDESKKLSGIVGIFIDLTERKRLEDSLRKAKEAADSMSQAKGDFLANMSHEIRTPMNAILGMAHLALNTDLDEAQHKYISRINESAKNLLGIINDILDFSKVETGKLSIEHIDFCLDEVLSNLTSSVSLRADEKGLEFILDIDPKIPTGLIGDPLRLGQVLVNLAGNSIKFTDSGEVIVVARLEKQTDSGVVIHFLVKDTGIGIPEDKMETLFSAFSQADSSITRKFGGTGLGLSISKQLVELMGGDITLSSAEGEGSVFEFSIRCGLQAAKMRDLSEPIHGLAGKRALVVDDNDSARHILTTLLKAMHVDAVSVSNGPEALDELKFNSYDMIFVDWNMPGMNGIELLHRIEEQNDQINLKRFLVTAYGREISLEDESSLVDALIVKPLNPSMLLDSIVNSLGIEYVSSHLQISEKIKKPVFSGQSILVVEDNEINQEVILGLLEGLNIQVSVAENGRIAIDLLSEKTFDLVLMDMQMPVLDGISATIEIRKQPRWQSLPIVAMTANAMQSDIDECLNAGMNDHIAKPIDISRLYRVLTVSLGLPEYEINEELVHPSQDVGSDSQEEGKLGVDQEERKGEQDQLPQLDGINLSTAVVRVGGDKERYLDILYRFAKIQGEEFLRVKQLVHQQQWEDAIRAAHTVKGTAANLSVGKVARLAGDIERDLKKEHTFDEEKFDEITYLLKQLTAQLDQWYSLNPKEPPSDTAKAVDAVETYTVLVECINNYDMAALDLIHQIRGNEFWTDRQQRELLEAIEAFDFDHAKSLLDQYPKPSDLSTE